MVLPSVALFPNSTDESPDGDGDDVPSSDRVNVRVSSPRFACVSLSCSSVSSATDEMTTQALNKVTCKQDMNEEGFFEGTEKLLEVWFSSSLSDGKSDEARYTEAGGRIAGPDLRRIDR